MMVYLIVSFCVLGHRLNFPSMDHVDPGTEDGFERLPEGRIVLTSGTLIVGDITLHDDLECVLVITKYNDQPSASYESV